MKRPNSPAAAATRTADLGGPLGTKAFTAALCARIRRAMERS